MTRGAHVALHFIPMVLLVAAIGAWPYGYYTALRFVVCITASWLAAIEYMHEGKVTLWAIAFGLVAILFNPILPVFFTRAIWSVIDVVTAGLLAAHFGLSGKRQS